MSLFNAPCWYTKAFYRCRPSEMIYIDAVWSREPEIPRHVSTGFHSLVVRECVGRPWRLFQLTVPCFLTSAIHSLVTTFSIIQVSAESERNINVSLQFNSLFYTNITQNLNVCCPYLIGSRL